jgi:hypothetical protein
MRRAGNPASRVSQTATRPPPTLAPSTIGAAASIGKRPAAAKLAKISSVATEECSAQPTKAATAKAVSGSRASQDAICGSTADWRRGSVASPIIRNDRRMNAMPSTMRPACRICRCSNFRNMVAPVRINSGINSDRSNDSSFTTSAEPKSAPSKAEIPMLTPIRARGGKAGGQYPHRRCTLQDHGQQGPDQCHARTATPRAPAVPPASLHPRRARPLFAPSAPPKEAA